MTKNFSILIAATLFLLVGCSKPITYYTNPNSAGYYKQEIGAICSHCNKMMKVSGSQLQNTPKIQCPYCGNFTITKSATTRWVSVKKQREQQANEQMLIGVIQGVANGLDSYNKSRSTSAYNSYAPSGCSSDYDCSMGKRCVKKRFEMNGVCMKSVNEYGTQTYNLPSSDSFGVNLDDGCSLNSDCPIGFACDFEYKVCIKR